MPYGMITMHHAVKQMFGHKPAPPGEPAPPRASAFVWEKDRGVVHPELKAQFKYGRRSDPVFDLLEYCWLVYSKAWLATGAQLIGRTGDLWVPNQLSKAGMTDTKTQTLWDNFTKGNIQVMDKWAPVVNDCWVLGGVHRQAEFEIVSVRSIENLWDFRGVRHVVTAREILGLIHFGYKLQELPAKTSFICVSRTAAVGATIEEYDRFMREMESKGPAGILSLIK